MGLLNWDLKKAKKEYICSNCEGKINKGDIYMNI